MKIKKVSIYNFRFFLGIHEFTFSVDAKKPLTVFVGENTGGKSSVFNSIYWCFFGVLLPGSNFPNEVINRTAKKNDEKEAFVEIDIQINDKTYQIKRETGLLNSFSVSSIINGNFIQEKSPDRFIKNLIPSGLKDWFFYDGEAALKSRVSLDSGDEIKKSLRAIQGFNLVDALISDIERIIRSKSAAGAKLVTGNKTDVEKYEKIISDLEHIIPLQADDIDKIKNEIAALNLEKKDISQQLRAFDEAGDLEKQKNDILKNLRFANGIKQAAELRQAKLLSNSAFSLILKKEIEKFDDLEEEENEKSILVEEPFGEKLFNIIEEKGICICGRTIKKGSQEENCLKKLKEVAPEASYNLRVANIKSAIVESKAISNSYSKDYELINDELRDASDQITDYKNTLIDIEEKYKKIDSEKIKELKESERSVDKKIADNYVELGNIQGFFESNKLKLKENSELLKKISQESGKNTAIQIEIRKLEKLQNFLKHTLIKNESMAYKAIFSNFESLMKNYFYDPVQVIANEDNYSIKIIDKTNNEAYIDSTGSGEITKYFWVSSVLGIASENSPIKDEFLAEPTSLPLVMDAPFTSMSATYSQNVLEALLENVNQLVFLALPDKFKSYENEIKNSIGKLYLIVKNVSSTDKIEKELTINKKKATEKIYGIEYDFIKYDQEFSGAELKEIKL